MTVRILNITKLYEEEHSRLKSLVRRIVGNRATAEDLVQHVFTNILGQTDDKAMNSAYVSRAVRNLALNYLRDTRRRANIELSQAEVNSIADLKPNPEMIALYRSELRLLLEAVASLSPRRREAFALNKIEGLSYDETAAKMGISRNTVITLIVSAMVELDRILQ
ncbi:RNA polymerase sigma factor [Brucellaceae bacterium C25G]